MSLCIEDILIVTPTEGIAHRAVIKDGWALNQEEIQSPDALMSSIVKWKWHILLAANPVP